MTLTETIPAMPVRDVASPVALYRDRDELCDVLRRADVPRPVSKEGVGDVGTCDFATVDLAGNLVAFLEWRSE